MPLLAELVGREVVSTAQDVEVRMPVRGGYCPFDLIRRKATFDAATPPASPPEPPESSDKTIQSIGERLRITGKGKCDEPGGFVAQPVAYAGGEDGATVGCTWETEPIVAVVCGDPEAVGVLI